MPGRRLAALPLLLALAACASTVPAPKLPMTPQPPGLPPAEFKAVGEVLWADIGQAQPSRRAAFDGWRVAGPAMDLARMPDGRWVGTFGGVDVALTVKDGLVQGNAVDLSLLRQQDGSVLVSGIWLGAPVRITLSPDRIKGGAGANAFDLTWLGPGMYNSYAGLLQLRGAAGQVVDPVLPQLVLALLAVLLG
jgi:hypothetical protein